MQTAIKKFQEEWYPEGIDPTRKTFLKRAFRNYSFDPNRILEVTSSTNKPPFLIP